ncbi:serine/threonine protein kinase [Phytohalomonas tamaricis]|uniref:serine/threonine protein kinase n=1 Tax=Phytohalomonas tamaricis TaxID=2081032 RepID=UPI000D0AC69D|nr:serine/threonine protein kinase [Phytohalomonas tamaricis]
MATPIHPFEALRPERVVAAIESLGFEVLGEPFALNSYENRVYAWRDDTQQRWVAKFYRPERWNSAQILEEHAFLAELDRNDVKVGAAWSDDDGKTLHDFEGFRFTLFRHVIGQAPELDNPAHLFALGELLGRMHSVAGRIAFIDRPSMQPEAIMTSSRERVLASNWMTLRQRQAYQRISAALLELIPLPNWPSSHMIRVHGDCHIGNMLGRDDEFALVDFDDCCMAPAVQDIWMLLTAQNEQEWRQQLAEVLEGYEQYGEFPRSELKWIEALRTLRLMRHSAWLVDRWDDPAFPVAFPWVASEGYWDQHIRTLEQQRHALERPPWLA